MTTTVGVFSVSSIADDSVVTSEIAGEALRLAGLEQLDDARQPCVMSAPATPPVWNVRMVSRPRARLTDRLGGDDADRVADLADWPGPSNGRSRPGTRPSCKALDTEWTPTMALVSSPLVIPDDLGRAGTPIS